VALGVIGTGAAVGLGLLGREHWEADLLSHFRVQYVLALLLAGAYFLARRRWFLLLPTLVLLASAGWPVADYFLPRGTGSIGRDKWQLRVMSLNVEASNNRTDLVSAAIEQANPDVVFLPEATATWADALAPLRKRYRYGTGDGSEGAFSLLLLSQLPVRDAHIIELSDNRWPAIVARICPSEAADEKDCVGFVGIHPPPPMSADLAEQRNAVFQALPAALAAIAAGARPRGRRFQLHAVVAFLRRPRSRHWPERQRARFRRMADVEFHAAAARHQHRPRAGLQWPRHAQPPCGRRCRLRSLPGDRRSRLLSDAAAANPT